MIGKSPIISQLVTIPHHGIWDLSGTDSETGRDMEKIDAAYEAVCEIRKECYIL